MDLSLTATWNCPVNFLLLVLQQKLRMLMLPSLAATLPACIARRARRNSVEAEKGREKTENIPDDWQSAKLGNEILIFWPWHTEKTLNLLKKKKSWRFFNASGFSPEPAVSQKCAAHDGARQQGKSPVHQRINKASSSEKCKLKWELINTLHLYYSAWRWW